MPQPRVMAFVLNYNGRDLTLQSLASLEGLDYPELEVVVVDNGSEDGSYEAVNEAFPKIHQIRVEVNKGPASGMNHGLRHALAGEADYILLLNNDIEVDPAMVTEMVRAAESDPEIGCVGPKAYYYSDRGRIWSAGGIIRFKESVTRERGEGQLDRGQFDREQQVDYVNGCAMLIRRSALETTGLMDPLYYLGVEDADWCMRMKRQGFRCHYTPRARLWHMVSHTLGVYKPGRTFHTGRSSAIFVRRYANRRQWLSFLLFYTLSVPAAFIRELPKGNQRAAIEKLKGVREGLRVPLTPPPTASSE
ncbi:MAG: glycosyltransferase family 2 protein [Thermoanaerobaculia bacterium]